MAKNQWIIGIDEVGRGSLAGPVVVAGVCLKNCDKKILRGIKDSKKLTPKRREEWFGFLAGHPCIDWSVAKVYPRVIERINISRAANLAALRLNKNFPQKTPRIFLDGGLILPKKIPHKTIIKGDEKVSVIAAASIVAKVIRDRIMVRLHKKYPQYGFAVHKGYATKLHRRAIKKFGPAPIHRKSFLTKII